MVTVATAMLLQRIVEDQDDEICGSVRGIAMLVGFPEYASDQIHNAGAVFQDGGILARYRKQLLP